MRIAAGVDRDYTGEVRYGTGVQIGYFSQDMESHLDNSLQIFEEIEKDAPTHLYPILRNLLGAFLFPGDDIYKSISVLSGGEKSRVALLKLLLFPSNLLILDEPTNHLDLRSKDVLLDALSSFSGTLIFVSHDRYFIESLATSVLELGPSSPRLYPGDYDYYLWKIENEDSEPPTAKKSSGGSGTALERNVDESVEPAETPPVAEQPTPTALPKTILNKKTNGAAPDYVEQKRQKSVIRRLEKEQEGLLGKIEQLERAHEVLSAELAKPDVYTDGDRVKEIKEQLDQNDAEQQRLSKRWEELEAELEAAGASR